MTASHEPDAFAPPPPDIFDMERPGIVQVVPKASQAQPPTSPTISGALKAVRPLHFGLAGVAAAAVWVAWPYVFPDGAIAAQSASRLMLPATVQTLPDPVAPQPIVAEAATVTLAPEPQVTLPLALPPIAQPAPPAMPVQPHRPRAAAHRKIATAAPFAGAATARFTLNTVYAGQAWIQDDERTYVVQPGDKVKGIEIISIDVQGRRIITSQGVIH